MATELDSGMVSLEKDQAIKSAAYATPSPVSAISSNIRYDEAGVDARSLISEMEGSGGHRRNFVVVSGTDVSPIEGATPRYHEISDSPVLGTAGLDRKRIVGVKSMTDGAWNVDGMHMSCMLAL